MNDKHQSFAFIILIKSVEKLEGADQKTDFDKGESVGVLKHTFLVKYCILRLI